MSLKSGGSHELVGLGSLRVFRHRGCLGSLPLLGYARNPRISTGGIRLIQFQNGIVLALFSATIAVAAFLAGMLITGHIFRLYDEPVCVEDECGDMSATQLEEGE